MLRLIGLSAMLCVVCAAFGLGKVVPLTAGVENIFLVLAALSGTVLFGTSDAYETEAPAISERDD